MDVVLPYTEMPCPLILQPFVTFAYKVGWRDGEISSLTWRQVDLKQGVVRLEVGETKNDEGRTVYLDKELKALFNKLWENRKHNGKLDPHVFPNAVGSGRRRVRTLRPPTPPYIRFRIRRFMSYIGT